MKWSNANGYSWSKIIPTETFFDKVVQRDTRPGKWNWADVKEALVKLDEDPRMNSERRYVAIVNEDAGLGDTKGIGITPGLFCGCQLVHPGEVVTNHRHTSVALYFIVQGTGELEVEGQTTTYKQYDILTCPAWHYHEWRAGGTEDTLMYVIHDLAMHAFFRTLFWEEPAGIEHIRHMVKGETHTWTTTKPVELAKTEAARELREAKEKEKGNTKPVKEHV
jgi:gentisate 1,2-dioxygenase